MAHVIEDDNPSSPSDTPDIANAPVPPVPPVPDLTLETVSPASPPARNVTQPSRESVRSSKRALLQRVRSVHVVQTEPFYTAFADAGWEDLRYSQVGDMEFESIVEERMIEWERRDTSASSPDEPFHDLLPGLTSLSVRADPYYCFLPNWIQQVGGSIFQHPSWSNRRTSSFVAVATVFAADLAAESASLCPQHFCRTARAGASSVWPSRDPFATPDDEDDLLPDDAHPSSELPGVVSTLHWFDITEETELPYESFGGPDFGVEWAEALPVGAENRIDLRVFASADEWSPIIRRFCRKYRDQDLPETKIIFILRRPLHVSPIVGESSCLDDWRKDLEDDLESTGFGNVNLKIDCVFADTCEPCASCGQRYDDDDDQNDESEGDGSQEDESEENED